MKKQNTNNKLKKVLNSVNYIVNASAKGVKKISCALKKYIDKFDCTVKNISKKYFNKYLKRRTTYFINAVTLVCFIAILASGINTFAKYYSQQRQKGVAMASNFYFSSDILAKGV